MQNTFAHHIKDCTLMLLELFFSDVGWAVLFPKLHYHHLVDHKRIAAGLCQKQNQIKKKRSKW